MTILGRITQDNWSVSVEAHRVSNGFQPTIQVDLQNEIERFEHRFRHHKVFSSEQEAVLEGLREGVSWIRQKMANSFSL